MAGVDIKEEEQVKMLSRFSSRFKNEYESLPRFPTKVKHQYYLRNHTFESVDGEVYYSMIRHFKPRKIFEIGAGYSTYLAAQAILKNKEEDDCYKCELVAIEPYPNDVLERGFPGLSKLLPRKVQEIPLSEFEKLRQNDILFIDSSHVLRIGSDVQYEYLDILPRLNRGVIVHIHDIFLPLEYPKKWILKDHFLYTEQYLLQAFLAFNDTFEVLWAGEYMHLKHPDKLKEAFSSYKPSKTKPGSFWIRRIK